MLDTAVQQASHAATGHQRLDFLSVSEARRHKSRCTTLLQHDVQLVDDPFVSESGEQIWKTC
jgi:hypothetical protein